jgi:arylsulfatase A-like enzyme
LPGKDGLNTLDPTLAELLKPLGYKTGQFGKNHLGDRDDIFLLIMVLMNFSEIFIT